MQPPANQAAFPDMLSEQHIKNSVSVCAFSGVVQHEKYDHFVMKYAVI